MDGFFGFLKPAQACRPDHPAEHHRLFFFVQCELWTSDGTPAGTVLVEDLRLPPSHCGQDNYCPDLPLKRAESAVFLVKASHGASFVPPAATGTVFNDVPASFWPAPWIERLAAEGVTTGCGDDNYCPDRAVSRAEMARGLSRPEPFAHFLLVEP